MSTFNFQFVQDAKLNDTGAPSAVISGTPRTSSLSLYSDEHVKIGIWEATPGVFGSTRSGTGETMHFVSGAGHIKSLDGETYTIRPGDALVIPDGWSGEWHVTETVRKMYVIYHSASTAELSDGELKA